MTNQGERGLGAVRGKHVRVILCVLIVLGVWVRNWRFPEASAAPIPDPSFMQALGYALLHRMQFGTEVVYTYGPLGWFNGTPHQPELDWIACFAWELLFKLVVSVFFGLAALEVRSVVGLVAFAFVLIVPDMGNDAYFFLATAAVGVWAIRRANGPGAWLIAPLVVLAVIALDKFTYTMLVFFAVACIAVASGKLVRALGIAGSFALMFVVAWAALGQSPANLPAWFRTSFALVVSYATAQSLTSERWFLAAAVVVLALWMGMAAWRLLSVRRWPEGERRAVVLVTILCSAGVLLSYKAGFTRASGNEICLFAFAATATFLWRDIPDASARARGWFAGSRGVLYVVAVVGFCGVSSLYALAPKRLVPAAGRRIAVNLGTVFSLREHEAMRVQERLDLARKYALPRTKRLVGDATIDVFGAEQAFVFLNDMNWHPRPLFQGYCVMTDAFSAANARFLAGPDAPRFMLYLPDAIDYRLPGMEDARSLATLLRDYRPVLREHGMVLFERGTDAPHSLQRELLLEREIEAGESLDLSGLPGDILELQVETRLDLVGRLRTLAQGAPLLWLETTTSDGVVSSYRVIPSMLEYGGIVRPWLQSPGDWVRFLAGDPVHALSSVRFAADSSGWHTPFVVRVWRADELRPKIDSETDARLRWSMFSPVPDKFESPTPPDPTVLRGYMDVLVVQAPSTLTWILAAGTYRLHALYGFLPSAWREGPTDGAIARVEVRRKGGRRDIVFERKLDPRRDVLDSRLSSLDFELNVEAGDEVSLTTDPGAAGDTQRDLLFWSDVAFTPLR